MSASVLVFPRPCRPIPAPPLDDRPGGLRALLIQREGAGYVVKIVPALDAAERALRQRFATARQARAYARNCAIAQPRRFRAILDETRSEGASLPAPRDRDEPGDAA